MQEKLLQSSQVRGETHSGCTERNENHFQTFILQSTQFWLVYWFKFLYVLKSFRKSSIVQFFGILERMERRWWDIQSPEDGRGEVV